jgi:hypothetical protein
MMKDYLVQPDCYGERKADYEAGKQAQDIFIPLNPRSKKAKELFNKFDGVCGNMFVGVVFNGDEKKFIHKTDKMTKFFPSYVVISCALFLYRLICIFDNPVVKTDGHLGYKVPWAMYFVHEPTGVFVCFSEWKGAISVRTPYSECENEKLNNDILSLLNLIVSDKSPHPYDGLTAGGVA